MKKAPLQIAVVLVLLGLFLTGTVLYSYINYIHQTGRVEKTLNEKMENTYQLFHFFIEEEKAGLEKVLAVLTRTEVLLENLQKKDRKGLLNMTSALFEDLKNNFRITHLYFIEPSGSVLLRVHKPRQYGDILNRITYNEARKNGKTATGIEMGKNFFSLRAIQPVDYQGEFVGYMEAGLEIDHIFSKVKRLTGGDISLFLSNAFIKQKKVQISGESIKGFTLLESTSKDGALEIIAEIEDPEQGMTELQFSGLKLGKDYVLASISPFKDAAGEITGVLMIHYDYTRYISDSIHAFTKNTSLFLAGALIFFLLAMTALSAVVKRRVTLPVERIIKGLSAASEEVADASGQLTSSGSHLAQETIKMTENISHVYSLSNRMTDMTKQNSGSASKSEALTKETIRVVEDARTYIGELKNSMNEILNSGHETEGIVKTIDEVAFQTRLLALNAAVEAARVGDAGEGFAVVADEVKKLSQKASDAAQNTSALIGTMIQNINEGADNVRKTGESFETVFNSADTSGSLISEITSASLNQSKDIEQINITLADIEDVSRHTASGAEQLASVSESLNQQAEELRNHVKSLVAIIGEKSR